MATVTRKELLRAHEESAPAELVAQMETYMEALQDVVDVRSNPSKLFESEYADISASLALEGVEESLKSIDFGDSMVYLEGMSEEDPEEKKPVSALESHMYNLQALMENSARESRIANERNLNEITPFDGFLPFVILRSYLPLVGKDIMPYVVPKVPFVRIKEKYKYITTKDNKDYLRPDVYNDPDAVKDILSAAKGKLVTASWFPAGEEVTDESADADYTEGEKRYKCPTNGLRGCQVNLLAESGGILSLGDALDIDICIQGARGIVENAAGESVVVEVDGLQAYPDITSYSPQRSVQAIIRYPVKNENGKIEKIVEDKVHGSYNARTSTFELVSMTGATKQIKFGGHLSNKNNTEYISYRSDFNSFDHPIPEGFNMNVPLTLEDDQLYRETASVSILADAIQEMTEIFTNLEDMEIYGKIRDERSKWEGVSGEVHPFEHFKNGPVSIVKEVNVAYTNGQLMKRNQYIQDAIGYALTRLIAEVRTTCANDIPVPVAFCHPNVASLFVGDNVDWKIEPGMAVGAGIRSDYNMGVITADGNKIKLVVSQKFKEDEGLQGIVLPLNETNFLSWKHFKYNMIFSKDYHVSVMPNNPNIRGLSRYHTQSYVPLTFQLLIKNYKEA